MNGRHFRGIFFLTALYHCSGSMTYFWESLPTIFPERNSNFLVTPSNPPNTYSIFHRDSDTKHKIIWLWLK